MSVAISAVLITRNEEADIARAVDSVSWCEEVLVVDSGSTDRTVEICLSLGCRVIHREFTGFGDQKDFAVRQAAHDWVLVVDADEVVTPELRDEIRRKLAAPGDCHGYRIPITTVLWDGVVRTQARHTAAKLRLFDRRHGNFQRQLVHESVRLDGPAEKMQERMYNYSYTSLSDYFDKFNRYTTAAAHQCMEEGKQKSIASAIARFPLTFLYFYILKGFFLDGLTGAVWSILSAFYPTVKYLKLNDLRRTRAEQLPEQPDGLGTARNFSSANHHATGTLSFERNEESRQLVRTQGGRIEKKGYSLFYRAFLACTAALALFWIPIFGRDFPIDYSACLLFVVLVVALIWGYRAALLTTGFSVLSLDYFSAAPPNAFALPNSEDSFRLLLFIALALLTISVIYGLRRRPAR